MTRGVSSSELLLLVRRVRAAPSAVLLLLELVGGLQTLVRRVVPLLALGALEEHVAFFGLHGGRSLSRKVGELGSPGCPGGVLEGGSRSPGSG